MSFARYIFLTVLLLTANLSIVYAQTTCITPYFSCAIPQSAPPGYSCFCITPSGPISGMTGASQLSQPIQQLPAFCCTPAGKFGPFQNNGIPVGGSCYANTVYGAAYGQACY